LPEERIGRKKKKVEKVDARTSESNGFRVVRCKKKKEEDTFILLMVGTCRVKKELGQPA